MFNILKSFKLLNNKNHLTMILVLLTLLVIFPMKTDAKMSDYSRFDWDKYYETNKFMWGENCKKEDQDDNGNCKEDMILLGQKKYFVRLYKLLAKYQKKGLIISDDLIITTTYIGLSIEQTGNEPGDVDYKEYYYDKISEEINAGVVYDDELDEETYDTEDKYDEEEANKLVDEKDTIETLIKNSIAYYTYCYGIYGDPVETVKNDGSKIYTCPDGGTRTQLHYHNGLVKKSEYKCAVNLSQTTSANGYELGFWTYYGSKMANDSPFSIPFKIFGTDGKDKYRDQCEEAKDSYPEGTVYQYTDTNDKIGKHISYTKYFDFLKESIYFDRKPHLQDYFIDILHDANVDCLRTSICENSLEASGKYEEYEEDLQDARRQIIYAIIDALNENGISMQYEGYGTAEYNEAQYNTSERSSFYWPIGSDQVEERSVSLSGGNNSNGTNNAAKSVKLFSNSLESAFKNEEIKLFDEANTTKLLFADGTPKYTLDDVESYFGERTNPITGEKETHYGIDIKADEGTNIIAAYDGVVNTIKTGCTPGDYECNEGLGNYIIISHNNGDYTVYGLLSSVESQISEGGQVLRGELIGKSGSTGATKTPSFHYELRIGGNSVANASDPISNTSAGRSNPPSVDDLRPKGYDGSGIGARSTKFDGTHLTQSEFAGRVSAYCQSHPGQIAAAMCNNPELVYEASRSANVNPELVITRAMAEGNSPGAAKNNYWGMGCYNTGGYASCFTYSSLEEGIRRFGENVSKYNNLLEMHSKYAYIGRFWYNPGSWSVGGCKYFPYIKGYMSPQRQDEVTAICGRSTECNTGGGDCTPTTPEDQNAYATWQVEKKIGVYMHNVFGT